MSKIKRPTGTDAKVRRGDGWGGKGSCHPTAKRSPYVDHRRYVPYHNKRRG